MIDLGAGTSTFAVQAALVGAFLKVAAWLKPGGTFYLRDVIFSFPLEVYQTAISEWISQVAQPEGQGWTAQNFEMHVREEYNTYTWIIEEMLKRAGFDVVEVNYPSPAYAEYVCVAPASLS
ncbi:hypothetical protein [Pseudanabaena sp. FACHB-2040]|uniref:hypothetical protein n=1 Tax=Pseudanabaena sp. FACHB-2040 TaxID=2692859 RepID=UPI0016875C80|nr:hypothetical protein [Pseudanabaena sp. FACHB-2040]MBD2256204.1 hypothetical protein [Pseudanabaena sp. FACHB-2040]